MAVEAERTAAEAGPQVVGNSAEAEIEFVAAETAAAAETVAAAERIEAAEVAEPAGRTAAGEWVFAEVSAGFAAHQRNC